MNLNLDSRILSHNNSDSYKLNNLAVIVSPHQDDESIGFGGTIALLHQKGYSLHFIFTTIESTRRALNRKIEAIKAIEELGGDENNTHFLELPDGDSKKFILNYSSSVGRVQEKIREIELSEGVIEIAENKKEILIDNSHTLILTTSHMDAHRDHEETFNMIKNGLRKKIILEFPVVNHMSSAFTPNCYIAIEENIYEKKKAALKKYWGEDSKGRIMWEDIDSFMKGNGAKINKNYAETCFISWYGYLNPIK